MLYASELRTAIAISLGAIAGALSRYYISVALTDRLGLGFPYGTTVVNLSGAFIMGLFVALVAQRLPNLSPELRLLISVGFLGSFTTFSTYALDTVNLLRDRPWFLALFYWAGSPILGVLGLYAGARVARFWF